jgi:hypothetical protein
MLNAHVLNAKVIHNEAKLDRKPLVFPKSRSRVGFVVSFLFQLLAEEIIGQNAHLGQPIATTANFNLDPPIDVIFPSKPVLQNKLFWNVCDFNMDVLWIFHRRVEVDFFMSMHTNRAPFLEMTLLSMSLMSSNNAVLVPVLPE